MITAMILEDEKWIAALIRSFIHKNFDRVQVVCQAVNGEEALEQLRVQKPDILLADIQVPVKTGLEAIEEAKKEGIVCECAVITGYREFDYVRKAMQLGLTDYLLKPIEEDDLCEVIRKFIKRIEGRRADRERLQKRLHAAPGEEGGEHVAGKGRLSEKPDNYAVRQAQDYVGANLDQPLSLTDTAGYVCLNPAYFSALFSKETGSGYVTYVTNCRMEKAKELLRISNEKIESIAKSVGYQDAKYFGRLFKQNTGVTPKEYRRIYR